MDKRTAVTHIAQTESSTRRCRGRLVAPQCEDKLNGVSCPQSQDPTFFHGFQGFQDEGGTVHRLSCLTINYGKEYCGRTNDWTRMDAW